MANNTRLTAARAAASALSQTLKRSR